MQKHLVRLALLLAVSATGSACAPEPPPQPLASGGARRVDAASVGHVTGRVTFEGTPPAPEPLHMAADQACLASAGPNAVSDAALVGPSGALRNVFVWIKDGLDPAYGFDVPADPVVLDQQGCVYTPRVVGVMAGQPLEVRNSDATLHNVHAMPTKNLEFNQAQPLQGMKLTHVFTTPEVPVKFMCNVHNWMAAHVGVVAHPYFAVTTAEGSFEIRGLPAGTYTVEAWHEVFGTRTATVTVTTGQTTNTAFAFQAKSGAGTP